MQKTYLCIDLKSFYASVECVELGLDPFKVNLVVADPTRGGGAITLAATPTIKKLGVSSRGRIFEIDPKTQTNKLYEMLVTGQINVFVFAYFYAQSKFTIDFSKITDLYTYRNLKIAEYVRNFELNEVLI